MFVLSRRALVTTPIAAAAHLALREVAQAARRDIAVGAIRWDPWYIQSKVGPRESLEDVLSPLRWQKRAPSCARVVSLDQIDFGGCATQTQIDREITYANRAGLDYWAFVWYGKKDDMQNAWRLYRATQIQKNIKWCMIFANCSLFVKELSNSPDEYLDYFRDRDYQKVLGGRPLIYLLPDPAPLSTLSSAIGAMRSSCRSARLSDPYVVFLTGAIRYAAELVGADAVGIYSKATKAPVAGPYAELAEADKVYWSQLASTGQSVVPTVLTGADRRPRVERPVPWEASRQKPYVGDDLYYVAGTPEEIAAHVRELITWVDENPATCPARTGLIYSWDEHDEGGSTLNPTLGDGSAILDAVTRVLTRDK